MASSWPIQPKHDMSRQNNSPPEIRGKSVFVREDHEVSAMHGLQRLKTRVCSSFCRFCYRPDKNNRKKREDQPIDMTGPDEDDEKMEESIATTRQPKQYRLEAIRQVKRSLQKRIYGILTCFVGTSIEFGVNSSQTSIVARSLHWCFRVNIFVLFTLMCVVYFCIALSFGGLIVAAGVSNPKCIYIGNYPFGSFGSRYYDAFFLSWTTLATTGYGAVYPALSNQNNDRANCAFITALTSFEVLAGLMYSGFCGAMLFAKVLRVQSHAQVMFSDPIIIRYGSGVEGDHHAQTEHHSGDEGEKQPKSNDRGKKVLEPKPVGLPVLEFRIVNRCHDHPGGEIIDARLNIVANVDAQDADPSVRDALDVHKRWKRAASYIMQSFKRADTTRQLVDDTDAGESSASGSDYQRQSSIDSSDSNFVDPYSSFHGNSRELDGDERHHRWGFHIPRLFHRETIGHDPLRDTSHSHSTHGNVHRHHVALDEDPESRLVTKRIFSKMHLEASDHPFFKRVWLVRHILNEHSPIVKPRVRRLIRRNHGHWPEELNSYQAVRDSLSFNQIVVSFHGVCNVSAATVFAQKIYDHVDLSIGYQFVTVVFCGPDGEMQLDTDLINDVVEQNGGGGEPLVLDVDVY